MNYKKYIEGEIKRKEIIQYAERIKDYRLLKGKVGRAAEYIRIPERHHPALYGIYRKVS